MKMNDGRLDGEKPMNRSKYGPIVRETFLVLFSTALGLCLIVFFSVITTLALLYVTPHLLKPVMNATWFLPAWFIVDSVLSVAAAGFINGLALGFFLRSKSLAIASLAPLFVSNIMLWSLIGQERGLSDIISSTGFVLVLECALFILFPSKVPQLSSNRF